ncbi:gypsy type transposase [Tanacetum coccineum]|uniref:Gypsy type transposase n=1 Tax=Tanacetum coccineum TaxID=301880 RepID=A0ABQ4ZPN3_9ASTR
MISLAFRHRAYSVCRRLICLRGWDQFETNAALFGVTSTFDEELYTTKLDRGPMMREREREALRIAREIEGEDTQDLHLAEERGIHVHSNFELDEETKYSSVMRGVDDSGYEENEDIWDSENTETFGNVSDNTINKSLTDSENRIPVNHSSQKKDKRMLFEQYEASKLVDAKKESFEKGLSAGATAYAPSSVMSKAQETTSSSEVSEGPTTVKINEATQPATSTSECGNVQSAASAPGLSPSSSMNSLNSEKSTLNPHAKEFKFNPKAKSFVPSQTPVRPASAVSDGSYYYSPNVAPVSHMPMGTSFAPHQPVMYGPQATSYQSQQPYFQSNIPQYGQQMHLGQPRQMMFMPTYPPIIGIVDFADRNEEDQPAPKRRLLSTVVKVSEISGKIAATLIAKWDESMVLILSEKLHSVILQFDQLRVVHFQKAVNRAKQSELLRKMLPIYHTQATILSQGNQREIMGWDQFETNVALFGVTSTFDEELYTTKLDRGPMTREKEREALRIAREIEGEDTQDLHLAEETASSSEVSEGTTTVKIHEATQPATSTSECGNEFKFNPKAKSFVPLQTPVRPASPDSDGSYYYPPNVAPVSHMQMGTSFGPHQQVMYGPQTTSYQSQQPYFQSNIPQYGQQMHLGQPRQMMYMPTYPTEYFILKNLHPELPGREDHIVDFPEGKIGVYIKKIEFANFRIPISQFLFDILGYYQIHLSQLSVIGAAKVSHFEINCRVLNIIPTVNLFRVFYVPSYNSGWMSFSKRPGKNTPQCYTKPLDSLKNWNNRFFWVDEKVFPTVVAWRTGATKDDKPQANTYSVVDVATLDTHRTPFQKQPEELLCIVGLSRNFFLHDDEYPTFLNDNDQEMDLFNLIKAPNPTKVKTGTRQRAAHEVPLMTTTASRVIQMVDATELSTSSGTPSTVERSPLDVSNEDAPLPVTQGIDTGVHGSVAAEQEIPVTDDAGTTEVTVGPNLVQEVISMGPTIRKKRRQRDVDEGGPQASTKVLRKDHDITRVKHSAHGGKSLAGMSVDLGLALHAQKTQEPPIATQTVNEPNLLSYVKPMSQQDVTQSSKEKGIEGDQDSERSTPSPPITGSPGSIYQPRWGVPNNCRLDTLEACQDVVDHIASLGYFSELRHLPNDEFLSQYNMNLARQVAMGSQLRLRFEQEAKLLKKSVAQVARRDQRIATREKHIKELEAQLEAEINMKKATEVTNSEVTKELEDLRMRFSGLEVGNA